MKDLKTTNRLLLLMVIPLMFYLLKVVSFIIIPLVAAMFISLLFLPIMRKLNKLGVPKLGSLLAVLLLIAVGTILGIEIIQLAAQEIKQTDASFFAELNAKLSDLRAKAGALIGVDYAGSNSQALFNGESFDISNMLNILRKTATGLLMTIFFVVLLLAGSLNLQVFLRNFLFKQEFASIRIFRQVERGIQQFVVVKFIISLFTGIGFSAACYFFDIDFPIFWGLFAFAVNFIQMIGSVVSVILLSGFALVQMDSTGSLAAFILIITGVQILFGAILEPIFMGRTFSINVITILVMLAIWGFVWGIPGLIMAIPITVFLKITLEQFPKTRRIAETMEGPKEGIRDWLLPSPKIKNNPKED